MYVYIYLFANIYIYIYVQITMACQPRSPCNLHNNLYGIIKENSRKPNSHHQVVARLTISLGLLVFFVQLMGLAPRSLLILLAAKV